MLLHNMLRHLANGKGRWHAFQVRGLAVSVPTVCDLGVAIGALTGAVHGLWSGCPLVVGFGVVR
jgi:hypothetical protein